MLYITINIRTVIQTLYGNMTRNLAQIINYTK